jgi:hypothetical protein
MWKMIDVDVDKNDTAVNYCASLQRKRSKREGRLD